MSDHVDAVETLIFLDIDGVLNVGIQDPGKKPISFNEANASVARKMEDSGTASREKAPRWLERLPANLRPFKSQVPDTAEIFLFVMRSQTGDGDSSTYGDFFSRADIDICNIFVSRLAQIIRAAGPLRRVILASSWRRAKYLPQIQILEQIISGFIGQEFKFDGRTALKDEVTGGDRLRLIGDYIATHCTQGQPITKLRIMVLDDFFYLPITDFDCGSTVVNSRQSAESYLQACAPSSTEAKARIIHTFGTCLLPSGLEVKLGTGLSLQHFRDAITWLDSSSKLSFSRTSPSQEVAGRPTKEEPLDANMSGVAGSIETLIFLDIDGVLNVGIQDPGRKPLTFNEANVSIAQKLEQQDLSADVILAVMRSQTYDGDSSTYGNFLSRADIDICNVFVSRLAQIIRAAGATRRVVLSSSWRRDKYLSKIQILEQIISGFLGQEFTFDGRTALKDEVNGGDRLRLIGDYIATHCGQVQNNTKIRVLVLDDFFYLPVCGFDCGGTVVDSLQSAEAFLEACAPSITEAKARIVHTYGTCSLPSGAEVHLGTGLSLQHFRQAITFLDLTGTGGGVPVAQKPVMAPPSPVNKSAPGRGFGDDLTESDKNAIISSPVDTIESLIFLDIDGVLNVGIQDPENKPLTFNEANVSIANKLTREDGTAEILLAVMRSQTYDGDSSTYGNFLSRADIDICDAFVKRLAQIIRAAGAMRRVVLSSSWRRAKHLSKIETLEKIISEKLGQDFKFDDQTALTDEVNGGDRLRLIGDYIATYCSNLSTNSRVKVLVLDDFFYLPISGFDCGGTIVDSLPSAEAFLESRAPPNTEAKARIIHTYGTCTLQSGLEVHLGTGLSLQHLRKALAFFETNGTVELPGTMLEESKPVPSIVPVSFFSVVFAAFGCCSPSLSCHACALENDEPELIDITLHDST